MQNLLKRFGPQRSAYHPQYAFWYLKIDGFWTVNGNESETCKNNDEPTKMS